MPGQVVQTLASVRVLERPSSLEPARAPLLAAVLERPLVAPQLPPQVAAPPMLASGQRLEPPQTVPPRAELGLGPEPELALAQRQPVSASARAPSQRPPWF
jgi:hypothetical protein